MPSYDDDDEEDEDGDQADKGSNPSTSDSELGGSEEPVSDDSADEPLTDEEVGMCIACPFALVCLLANGVVCVNLSLILQTVCSLELL